MNPVFPRQVSPTNLVWGLMNKWNRNRPALMKPCTADLRESWVFGFFQIRNSTRKRATNGTENVSTMTNLTTTTKSLFDRPAWGLPAAPAISHRTHAIHRLIRKIRDGKISRPRLAINTSTKEKFLPVTSRRGG